MPCPYPTRSERLEARRRAALDVLGAVLFTACLVTPVALWWFRIL
jgi:hypothetical protein